MLDAWALQAINSEANAVKPYYDTKLSDGIYDCDDYAIHKVRLAIERGASPSDLKLLVVRTPVGLHMVAIYLDAIVLDNLSRAVYSTKAFRHKRYEVLLELPALVD
jgi:predicted transglutaminase-like cysteine proteinase